nr:hypothetical protein [Mesotoga sp. Brook.08.YT.4.2.5.1]
MRTYDIIIKKRNGYSNTRDELRSLIRGFVDGYVPDYQMAAWLMAVYFNHLDAEERLCLTEIMTDSGEKIDLSSISGIKVDKHSTGGVGDKVTLVVGPIVAAAGLVSQSCREEVWVTQEERSTNWNRFRASRLHLILMNSSSNQNE